MNTAFFATLSCTYLSGQRWIERGFTLQLPPPVSPDEFHQMRDFDTVTSPPGTKLARHTSITDQLSLPFHSWSMSFRCNLGSLLVTVFQSKGYPLAHVAFDPVCCAV